MKQHITLLLATLGILALAGCVQEDYETVFVTPSDSESVEEVTEDEAVDAEETEEAVSSEDTETTDEVEVKAGEQTFDTETKDQPSAELQDETGFKTFSTTDRKLQFLHNSEWKCVEAVYNERIDCYPLTREDEEYDAGLDNPIVYFPELTIRNENSDCSQENDVSEVPVKEIKPDVGTFYTFYRDYNGCEVNVMADSDFTSLADLEAVIK